jgi:hypothetical protein
VLRDDRPAFDDMADIYDGRSDTMSTASRMEPRDVPGLEDRSAIDVKGKGTTRAWILVRSK